MSLEIAIHERKGSFSDRWIEYCVEKGLSYKVVNCFDNNIISQLTSADALLWNWWSHIPSDILLAQSVIRTLESMGKKVFPNSATCWYYDNKIGQKYLLESIGAPLVPTYIFYDFQEALSWIEQSSFPKVFKLSRGAGSNNVRLVRSAAQARDLAKKAFGRGFKQNRGYFRDVDIRFKKARQRRDVLGVLKRMPKAFMVLHRKLKQYPHERDYLYFQDFVPDNQFDTRITIIGNRAFGFTRNVRAGDFRASGSGEINYDLKRIDPKCINIAFDVAKRLAAQSTAFDFVMSAGGEPKITEVSYCYLAKAVYDCSGY